MRGVSYVGQLGYLGISEEGMKGVSYVGQLGYLGI